MRNIRITIVRMEDNSFHLHIDHAVGERAMLLLGERDALELNKALAEVVAKWKGSQAIELSEGASFATRSI